MASTTSRTQLVAPGTYRVRGLYHAGIDLRYEFAVYNAGSPAWSTEDHTGGWLTNHTPPSSALFVPGDKTPGGRPLVYLGSYVSEGGDGLAWVDLEGRKQGGVGWIGGAWTGAPTWPAMPARRRSDGVYLYAGSAWEGELRLTAVTRSGDKPVIKYAFPGGKETPRPSPGWPSTTDCWSAVCRSRTSCCWSMPRRASSSAAVPLDDPRGLAFDGQGRLLALAGKQLHRYRLPAQRCRRGRRPVPPEVLVAGGLEDPQHVALDAQGNLYVSDRGKSHQVKVFDPGRQTAPRDRHGGPAEGRALRSASHEQSQRVDDRRATGICGWPKPTSSPSGSASGRSTAAWSAPSTAPPNMAAAAGSIPWTRRDFTTTAWSSSSIGSGALTSLVRVFFRPGPGRPRPAQRLRRRRSAGNAALPGDCLGSAPLFHQLLQQQSDQRRQRGDVVARSRRESPFRWPPWAVPTIGAC